MVKIIVQQTFRTFKEFSTNVYKNIMSLGVEIKAERTDIAADQYFKHSLKGGTQKDRRTGSQFVFNDETKFPNDFIDSFSKNSKNKDNLNKNLAQRFLILHESDVILILVVISSDSMLSNAVLHEPLFLPAHLRKLTNVSYAMLSILLIKDTNIFKYVRQTQML